MLSNSEEENEVADILDSSIYPHQTSQQHAYACGGDGCTYTYCIRTVYPRALSYFMQLVTSIESLHDVDPLYIICTVRILHTEDGQLRIDIEL